MATENAKRFSWPAKPWPSSSASMYSTSRPRSRSATTICSDSRFFTRGSLAPWITSKGAVICSAENSGDWARSRSWSAGSSGSPNRTSNMALIGFQYGGMELSNVIKLDGPT